MGNKDSASIKFRDPGKPRQNIASYSKFSVLLFAIFILRSWLRLFLPPRSVVDLLRTSSNMSEKLINSVNRALARRNALNEYHNKGEFRSIWSSGTWTITSARTSCTLLLSTVPRTAQKIPLKRER